MQLSLKIGQRFQKTWGVHSEPQNWCKGCFQLKWFHGLSEMGSQNTWLKVEISGNGGASVSALGCFLKGVIFSRCATAVSPLLFSSLGSMFESLLPPTCQLLLLLTLGVHVQTSSLSSSVSSQLNLQTPTSEDTRTGKKYFPPKGGQREEDESWGTYSGPQKSLSQIHLSFCLPFILSNQRGNKKTKKMCAKTWI